MTAEDGLVQLLVYVPKTILVQLQCIGSQNKIRNITVICISEGLSCGELPSITLSYCYPIKFLCYKRLLHTGRLQYITKARNSKYLKSTNYVGWYESQGSKWHTCMQNVWIIPTCLKLIFKRLKRILIVHCTFIHGHLHKELAQVF